MEQLRLARVLAVVVGEGVDRPGAARLFVANLDLARDVSPRRERNPDHPANGPLDRIQGAPGHSASVSVALAAKHDGVERFAPGNGRGVCSRATQWPARPARPAPPSQARLARRRSACDLSLPAQGDPDRARSILRHAAAPLPPADPESARREREDGTGPVLHRLYRATIREPKLTADRLLAIIAADPNVIAPSEVLRFEKTRGEPGRLQEGDELLIRMAGPWNAPVKVARRWEEGIRLVATRGHPQLGEVELRARDEDGRIVMEIQTRERAAGIGFRAAAADRADPANAGLHVGGDAGELGAAGRRASARAGDRRVLAWARRPEAVVSAGASGSGLTHEQRSADDRDGRADDRSRRCQSRRRTTSGRSSRSFPSSWRESKR